MKKVNIIKESRDYSRIIQKNNIFKHKDFYIFTQPNNIDTYRFGITVPTKLGNAVTRNKIKRQLKNIVDNNILVVVKKYDYVIIVKKSILNSTYQEIEKNLVYSLNKTKEMLKKYEEKNNN